MYKLRDYQERALNELDDWLRRNPDGNPIVDMAVGCHEKGQLVMRYSGELDKVENIKVGDLLMGDNSTPRKVLELKRGHGEMFKITPVKGESFIVNGDHILSVDHYNKKVEGYSYLIDISVYDYLKKPNYWQRNAKLYRGVIDDIWIDSEFKIPPYMLGVFIGDGCSVYASTGQLVTPNVTASDPEIIDCVYDFAESIGMTISVGEKSNNSSSSYKFCNIVKSRSIPNKLDALLKSMGLEGKSAAFKFVPDIYKYGSLETRKQVLAGLLDTDGSLSRNAFDYISKSEQLSNDVAFLARSIGLAAYVSECEKSCQNDFTGTYYRVSISGDCDIIPNRVARKIAPPRKQKKRVTVTGFTVEKVADNNFYGFSLDGNQRYLMGDFTVTHNSGKSVVIAEFCIRAIEQFPETRIIMCVASKELCEQNAEKITSIWPEAPVGICSASLGSQDFDSQIIFATIGSIAKYAHELGKVHILLVDECHNINPNNSGQYREFINDLKRFGNPHLCVIGFTGTPFRGDGIWLWQGTEPLFAGTATRVSMDELLLQGYLAPLVVESDTPQLVDTTNVKVSGGDYVVRDLDVAANDPEIIKKTVDDIFLRASTERKKWLIFCVTIDHADAVLERVRYIPSKNAHIVTSHTPQGERAEILRKYKLPESHPEAINCLVNVACLTTGFDAPETDLIALLRPTKSPVLYVQIAGRGMRIADGKKDCLWLDYTSTTKDLGAVNLIKGRNKRMNTEVGEAPYKNCEECGNPNLISARECIECGNMFPEPDISDPHSHTAGNLSPLMLEGKPKKPDPAEWVKISHVGYVRHRAKSGKAPTMRVDYYMNAYDDPISEWICIEHKGYALTKAVEWWSANAGRGHTIPFKINDALELIHSRHSPIRQPSAILVQRDNNGFDKIKEYKYNDTNMPPIVTGAPVKTEARNSEANIVNGVDYNLPF
ncbi:MAG: Hint domain-containing homing endonuclease [Psychrobacter sp.]